MVAWRRAAASWPFASTSIIGPRLKQFLSERAVEAMVSGTTQVFKDEILQARSIELKLTTPTKTRKPDEMDSSDDSERNEDENEAKPKAKDKRNRRKSKATSTRTKKRTRSRSAAIRPPPTKTASQTTPTTTSLPKQRCGRRPPRSQSVHRRVSSAWLSFEGTSLRGVSRVSFR